MIAKELGDNSISMLTPNDDALVLMYNQNTATTGKATFGAIKSFIGEDIDERMASALEDYTTKEYVDDAISTNSAIFRGSFETYADLIAYSGAKTNNDYAVVEADENHDGETWRYKYNGTGWIAEYKVNNTPFSSSQMASINSGITSEDVEKLDGIESQAQKNVKADWNETDETSDAYIKNKPAGLTIDNALSTSSTNALSNKVITNNISTIINNNAQATAKTIYLDGVTLYDGYTCKVLFLNGHSGSTFKINNKTVYVSKHGQMVAMTSHLINGVNWFINPYTTLELIYIASVDGWLILGNPEVITGATSDANYTIKADGFITIQGVHSEYSGIGVARTITFPFAFSSLPSVIVTPFSENGNGVYMAMYTQTVSNFKFATGAKANDGFSWNATGY